MQLNIFEKAKKKAIDKLAQIFNENTDKETLHTEEQQVNCDSESEDPEEEPFDEDREDDEDVDLLSEDEEFMGDGW